MVAFISSGSIQLLVGPASSRGEQMNVRSSTRATSSGSDAAQNELGFFSSSSRTKVPASTSWTSCGPTPRRSRAIRDNLKTFYDLTGIEVEILTDDLPVVQQKVGIDLRSGKADFQLNYVQDKPIGAPFADFFADLPSTQATIRCRRTRTAWATILVENFLTACGVYYEPGRIVAFPYDAAVACTFYRQDLFEQLSKDFEADHGYRMEFTEDTTWKNLNEFAAFFKKVREAGATTFPMAMASTRVRSPGRRSSISSA